MKRRIRELAAILLTVCMVFVSTGIESRAEYAGVPEDEINTEDETTTDAGWPYYKDATLINNRYTYTHYGWYGYFLDPSDYKVYSVDDIVTDEDGNIQDPNTVVSMSESVWTSTEAYRIPAEVTFYSYTISYKVNGNEATSTDGYIDVPAGSSISLKGEYCKAIGFMGGSDETYAIDNLANVRPTGVVSNIGTYDLQPDIRRYVTASYDMGAGTEVENAEFAADAEGNLTLSTLTDGKETGTAPEGYTLDHWEYYIGDSKITDSIDLLEKYSDTKSITCKAFWKLNSHNVTYDGDGATSGVPNSHKADYDSSVTVGEEPIKDGYKFVGWEQLSTGKIISAGGTFQMPDMDEILKAKWQIAYSKMGKGTFYLIKGQNYNIGTMQKVSGDTSVYSSGISFYVPSSGNYTFE